MGRPLRARNCLGCGPAIRVPSPAAGRIANTCITHGVYIGKGGCSSERCAVAQNKRTGYERAILYRLPAGPSHPQLLGERLDLIASADRIKLLKIFPCARIELLKLGSRFLFLVI